MITTEGVELTDQQAEEFRALMAKYPDEYNSKFAAIPAEQIDEFCAFHRLNATTEHYVRHWQAGGAPPKDLA